MHNFYLNRFSIAALLMSSLLSVDAKSTSESENHHLRVNLLCFETLEEAGDETTQEPRTPLLMRHYYSDDEFHNSQTAELNDQQIQPVSVYRQIRAYLFQLRQVLI